MKACYQKIIFNFAPKKIIKMNKLFGVILVMLALSSMLFFSCDERLKNTLRWLTEQKAFSQILIFTCHHREAEMLESLNCDYHYVEL